MTRIGLELIAEAKRSSEKSSVSKDILSLLVRENETNTVNPLTDEEVLAQVPTVRDFLRLSLHCSSHRRTRSS
jgi:hypothetical protein